MDFFMPSRLITGDGCVARASAALCALGSSCLIVTGAHAAQASGALDDATAALEAEGIACSLWTGVTENPPLASCADAGRVAAEKGAAFILGIGGGSALDAAKAVAVFAANPGLDEERFYAKDWESAPLPIALIGTTAGTGSEVTKVSVLTDSKARKHSIHDDRLYAAVSFGDSRYTRSCSPTTVLSAGVDVLAHATESYFSRKADEISRSFSVRALRLARSPLAAAAEGAALDDGQRQALYEASLLAGLAINTTGTCFPHNVGYFLTENFGVPHGYASAVFLPAMLERTQAYDGAYQRAFEDETGMSSHELAELVRACVPALDVALDAQTIEAVLPRWEGNGSVVNTRADVGTDDIRVILQDLFA